MLRCKFKKIGLLIIVLSLISLSSCSMDTQRIEQTKPNPKKAVKEENYSRFEFAFDTAIKIDVFSGGSERILDKAIDIIKDVEERMSYYSEKGELYYVNLSPADVEIEISNELFEVLNIAQDVYIASGGKFDVAIGELTELWRQYAAKKMHPNEEEVAHVLEEQGFNNIILMNNHIIKTNPHVKIDLGGIAKGYAADLVCRFLKDAKVGRAILNFGGNLVLLNSENGDSFHIGIQDPFGEKNIFFAVLKVQEGSVVTSGDYERFYELDGKKYHHIVDVENGFPVDNTLTSVTVVTKQSAYADAYSTAFFSLGLSEGLKLANSLEDVDAYFVTKNRKIYCSKNAREKLDLMDSRYKIVDFEGSR